MKNKISLNPNLIIYQAKSGEIAFRGDFDFDSIWGNLQQIADLFEVNKPAISKHLKNIYQSGELEREATISILETVQLEGERQIKRQIEYYNLDAILCVGYRVNSKQATQFRIWATQTLKHHLIDGFTINKKRIGDHYDRFMQAISDIKAVLPQGNTIEAKEVLDLVNAFAGTWMSLDAYDTQTFPQNGTTKKEVLFTASELAAALTHLKKELMLKHQASDLFGNEKQTDAIQGIVGNIFQTFDGQDVYPTIEEKAAHLLYFIVKNHPFTDGNKRSGAFAFVWFLRKAGVLRASLTPEALTALTLLVAESNPEDKTKLVGLILILLHSK